MSKKPVANQDDINKFMSAVYPEAPALALVSFSEKKVLNDAADLIKSLEKEVERLEDLVLNNVSLKHHLKVCKGLNDKIESFTKELERYKKYFNQKT